jgi:anthranilate synthase component 1
MTVDSPLDLPDIPLMPHYPSRETFIHLAREASVVPVYRQLTGDTLTPVSAFCKIQEGDWAFLFESVVGGERIGRYSFVGSGPAVTFQAWGERVVIEEGHRKTEQQHANPLQLLGEYLSRWRTARLEGLPVFCGGAVGYAGYDVIRYVEKLPHAPPDDRGLPDLCFALYDRMVIFDQLQKTVFAVAHAQIKPGDDLAAKYAETCRRVDDLVRRLQQGVADLQVTDIVAVGDISQEWSSNFDQPAFEAAVRKAQEYIKAGDIFQVVLSQRLQTETRARPFDIYRALRVVNPSPFMFHLKCGPSLCLIGASPEIMVRVEDRMVITRPLAGTRRRGKTEEEDRQLAAELVADPKERAEHIMLVDLGRNDVGRIAEFGSVELSDLMMVERYSHVMHISSTVKGKLQPNCTALDALQACLPAGTLSGAPKVRAMEIIDELEPCRRGPYGGAVGYLDFSGSMDTCIALRTMVLHGQTAYLQAGAGIVYDSVPSEEYQETLHKAKVLLKAIEIAEGQL